MESENESINHYFLISLYANRIEITRMMQPDYTLQVAEYDDTRHIIRDIINESNLKDMTEVMLRMWKKGELNRLYSIK